MNKPYKLIYKVKNNNKEYQYYVYIFRTKYRKKYKNYH